MIRRDARIGARLRAGRNARRRKALTAIAVAGAITGICMMNMPQPAFGASPTPPPPAVIQTPLRDPWVPPELRQQPAIPATHGAELRAQVERKLAAMFEAADVDHTGTLTRQQAKAAGLGFIVRHFDDIDVQRSGIVRFDDVTRYLDQRRARANSNSTRR